MVQAAVTAAAAADGYLRRGICDASLPSFKVNNYAAGKERRMRERERFHLKTNTRATLSLSFSMAQRSRRCASSLAVCLCV